MLSLLAACGGGGSSDAQNPVPEASSSPLPAPPAPPANPSLVSLTGLATFDCVPSQLGQLVYLQTEARPIRSAALEVVDTDGKVLQRTTTDERGRYSVSLAANQTVHLRVLAQIDANGESVAVTDNTRADALYAVESPAFDSNAGTANLHAASGWTGSGYTEARSAAPFAILDTVYRAQRKVVAVDPRARFKPLSLHWSTANKPAPGDPALGEIESTGFTRIAGKGHIYVMGDAKTDTDEYDESVIAHEWGHYYQWTFSRNDAGGGAHGIEQKLEMPVAFSEGWADAFSGLATERHDYSDALVPDPTTGQPKGLAFALDGATPRNPGWFQEESVAQIIYQLSQKVGFAPIHQAMQSLVTTPAFTSIFAFSDAVRRNSADAGDAIDDLLKAHSIVTSKDSGDPFGTNETNDGGLGIYDVPPYVLAMPIYQPLKLNVAARACSLNVAALSNIDKSLGIPNKLGNHRFMRFDAPSPGRYRVTVQGVTRGDRTQAQPVLSVLQGGTRNRYGSPQPAFYGDLDLPAGPTVLSLEDKDVTDGKVIAGKVVARGCIDVEITNTPVN